MTPLLRRGRNLLPALIGALVFAAAALPSSARAQAVEIPADAPGMTIKRVGMVAIGHKSRDNASALLIQALFRAELRKLDLAVLTLPVGGGDPMVLLDAQRLVDEGAALLRANRFADALSPYGQAVDIVSKYKGVPDRRIFSRAYKGLAIAQWLTGDKLQGKPNAQRSLLLWPNQSDTEWAYSLDATRLLRDVRVDWETMPSGTLYVQSQPDRAEVFIDGVSRGYTPITVPDLAAGPHHVFVAKDGYAAYQTWKAVASEQTGRVSTSLSPIPQSSSLKTALKRFKGKAKRPRRARAELDDISAAHGGADLLLVLTIRSRGSSFDLAGAFHRPGAKPRAVKERLAKDAYMIANVRGLVRNLFGLDFAPDEDQMPLEPPVAAGAAGPDIDLEASEDHFIEGGADIFREEKKEQEDSVFSKWWFWTTAGVVVAGAVTAAVLVSGGGGGEQLPTGQIRLDLHTPNTP